MRFFIALVWWTFREFENYGISLEAIWLDSFAFLVSFLGFVGSLKKLLGNSMEFLGIFMDFFLIIFMEFLWTFKDEIWEKSLSVFFKAPLEKPPKRTKNPPWHPQKSFLGKANQLNNNFSKLFHSKLFP